MMLFIRLKTLVSRSCFRRCVLVSFIGSAGIVCAAPSNTQESVSPKNTAARAAQLRELTRQIQSLQAQIDQLAAKRNAEAGISKSNNSLPDSNSAGAQLVTTYCTQCHATPQPSFHTATEWSYVTTRMRGRMEDNLGVVKEPTDSEMTTIVAYLQQFAH